MIERVKKILPLLGCMLLVAFSLALASEGGGHGEEGKVIWGMIWRIVNFAILMVLLWKMLADRIKSYFGDRRVEIAQMIEQADKAKEDAEKQFAEVQQKLKNVEKDIKEIKEAIMGELEGEKERIIQEGKNSAERILQQARWTAEQEVIKARKELKDHVVEMAGDMASGMITRSMTPEDQKKILEEYLDKVVKGN
jgi:F-type H+-transporting ATPase subunit b